MLDMLEEALYRAFRADTSGRWVGSAFRGPLGKAWRPLELRGVSWLAKGPGECEGEMSCFKLAELLGLLRNMRVSTASFSLLLWCAEKTPPSAMASALDWPPSGDGWAGVRGEAW